MLSKLEEVDVAALSSDVIKRRILDKIETLEKEFSPTSDWENQIVEVIRFCSQVGEGVTAARAYALSLVKDYWDELSLDFRMRYHNQYSVLVLSEAGVEVSTMDNYTGAAKVFFREDAKPSGTVAIPRRDAAGKPVIENNQPVMDYVEYSPAKVPITKMLALAPVVREGKMTNELWSAALDSKVTVDEIRKKIAVANGENGHHGPYFTLEGSILVYHRMGEHIEIAELFPDMWEYPLGKDAVRQIARKLGFKLDEDVIAQRSLEAKNQVLGSVKVSEGENDDIDYG